MTYTIKKSRIEAWGYEITAKGFHNIAPTVEAAVNYLQGRFGHDVNYRIKEDEYGKKQLQGQNKEASCAG